MAARKPLVIVNGLVQQLQSGDTLEGAIAAGGLVPGGRLTLASGDPLPGTDQTAKGTVYYTPYTHGYIDLYNGSAWTRVPFTEKSVTVPPFSISKPFDVFGTLSSGDLALFTEDWTNDTTRNVSLTRQNGYWVSSGSPTNLYLGTCRTTASTGQCEDSAARRLVWNAYNRVPRTFSKSFTGAAYTYSTLAFRVANNDFTNNKIDFVVGLQEAYVDLDFAIYMQTTVATSAAAAAIGFDSQTSFGTTKFLATELGLANSAVMHHAKYQVYPTVGYHYATGLERGAGTGTQTWTSGTDRGLLGYIMG